MSERPHAGLSAEDLAAWVAKSCAAQGVPVKVTDPTVLRRVAVLLGRDQHQRRGR